MKRICAGLDFMLVGILLAAAAHAGEGVPPADHSVSRVISPGANPDFAWPSVEKYKTWIFQLVCTPAEPWVFCPKKTWARSSSHEVWLITPNTQTLIAFTATINVEENRYEPRFGGGMCKPGGAGPGECAPWDIKGLEEPYEKDPPQPVKPETSVPGSGDETDPPTPADEETQEALAGIDSSATGEAGIGCGPCNLNLDDHAADTPEVSIDDDPPGSMPSLGERVRLHMIAGDDSIALSWGAHIGFGPKRPLNLLEKLRLSADKTLLLVYVPKRQGVVAFERIAPGRYKPKAGQLAFGAGTEIEVSETGESATLKHPDSRKVVYEKEAAGADGALIYRVVKRVSREGFATAIAYNADNVTITDASGHAYVCAFDSQKRITSIAVGGRTWTYSYQEANGLSKVTETSPDGSTRAVETDAKGRITAIERKGGAGGGERSSRRERDGEGRLMRIVGGGAESVIVESKEGDIRKRVYELGGVKRTFETSPRGLVGFTDAAGGKWTFTRDNLFRITSITDPEGRKWSYERDENGYMTRRIAPDGGVTTWSYDAQYNLIRMATATGAVWRYEYYHTADRRNNQLKKEIAPDGGVTEYIRDPATGLVRRKIDPRGNFTDYTYNRMGQVLTECGPYKPGSALPPAKRYEYDTWGNMTKKTDENGNSWAWEYDNMNRRIKQICPKLFEETWEYDGLGRLVKYTDRLGNWVKRTYDHRGLVVKVEGTLEGNSGGGCGGYSCGMANGQRGTYEYSATRMLTKFTDLNNHSVCHAYDSAGRKTKTIDPRGFETAFAYYPDGMLKTTTDANGHTTTYEYDAVNRLTKVIDPLGNATEYRYDLEGRQIAAMAADGGTRRTVYDSMGRVMRVIDELNRITRYFYDKNSNQIRMINALGTRTEYIYDAANRLIKTIEDKGGLEATTENQYDPAGRLTASIVYPFPASPGLTTRYEYNEADLLIKTISPMGNATTYEYDKMARRTKVIDPAGRSVTTSYTSEGWVKSVSDGVTTTTYEYDPVGNRIKVSVSGRAPVEYFYDEANNLIRTRQTANNITIETLREIDPVGNVIASTDSEGRKTRNEYDAANRLTKTINPLGKATVYEYDPVGRRIKTAFANSAFRAYVYDLAGQLIQTSGGPEGTTSYEYDNLGRQIKVTDANNRSRRTFYDNLSRVIRVENEMGQPVTYTYDLAGRRLTLADAKGNTTRYVYDEDSRLVSMRYPGGDEESYYYDAAGLLIRKRTPNREDIRYEYDASGALIGVKHGNVYVKYERDEAGAIKSIACPVTTMRYEYDGFGRMTSAEDSALSGRLEYEYDRSGLRTKMNAAGRSVVYKYDDAMRLKEVKCGPDAAAYSYDSAGRRTSLRLPNGVLTEYVYDSQDRLTMLTTRKGSEVLASFRYYLDPVGNRTGIDLHNGDRIRYAFDNAYRLTGEERRNAAGELVYDERFVYDAVGNRTRQVKNGVETVYSYNSNNQLVESVSEGVRTRYFYDRNGNMIRIQKPGEVLSLIHI